jgi:hypothetical protein
MGASLVHADRRTDVTMVKGAFRDHANLSKGYEFERFVIAKHSYKF